MLVAIMLLIGLIGVLMVTLFACIVLISYPGIVKGLFIGEPLPVPTTSVSAKSGVNSVITPPLSASSYTIYVSGAAKNLYQVDPQTDAIVKSIHLSNSPGDLAASLDGTRLFVCSDKNLTIINTRDNSIIDSISFDRGVAMVRLSPDGKRLYVNYHDPDAAGDVAIIDTTSYDIIDTIHDVPFSWGMAVSPDGKYLYMSDYWKGKLTVIDTKKAAIIKAIDCSPKGSISTTQYWKGHPYASDGVAADVAVSPDGKRVYVSIWSGNHMAIINADTLSLDSVVNMDGRSSSGVTVSPDGQYVYLTCHDDDSLLVINANDYTIEDRILVAAGPRHVRITPDGRYLYVFCEGNAVEKVASKSLGVVKMDFQGNNAVFASV